MLLCPMKNSGQPEYVRRASNWESQHIHTTSRKWRGIGGKMRCLGHALVPTAAYGATHGPCPCPADHCQQQRRNAISKAMINVPNLKFSGVMQLDDKGRAPKSVVWVKVTKKAIVGTGQIIAAQCLPANQFVFDQDATEKKRAEGGSTAHGNYFAW